MKWNEFLDNKLDFDHTGQIQTDIECPKCGRNIYLNTTIILTTYPAKYSYWCACGWQDCAPTKWIKSIS